MTQSYQVIAFDAATGRRRWRNTSGALASGGGTGTFGPAPKIVQGCRLRPRHRRRAPRP
jgi:hypothetical protein